MAIPSPVPALAARPVAVCSNGLNTFGSSSSSIAGTAVLYLGHQELT